MSDELKPCPHCGNSDHLMAKRVEGEAVSPDNFQVVCGWLSGGCGASGGVRRTEAEAIAAWNARADDAPKRTCELEETESYECRRFDTADPKLYATRLTVHVLECSECGRTCEHVNGTYPRCPYCSAVNVLDENYEPQVLTNGEKHELADSRERLEADMWEFIERWAFDDDDERRPTTHLLCSKELRELLYRQKRITIREHQEGCIYKAKADELRQQVNNLTAERDELRDKLDEKQHVCDVQRDSFLKLEAENAELRRMLSDAASAI